MSHDRMTRRGYDERITNRTVPDVADRCFIHETTTLMMYILLGTICNDDIRSFCCYLLLYCIQLYVITGKTSRRDCGETQKYGELVPGATRPNPGAI